jgi:hypothetical protein
VRENFCVHVGPIEKVKGGTAQFMGFVEKLFVTFKRQVQAGCGLIDTVHVCALLIDPFSFF